MIDKEDDDSIDITVTIPGTEQTLVCRGIYSEADSDNEEDFELYEVFLNDENIFDFVDYDKTANLVLDTLAANRYLPDENFEDKLNEYS